MMKQINVKIYNIITQCFIMALCCLSFVYPAAANNKYDVYYLAIGSGHYKVEGKNRPEAIYSAKTMASFLKSKDIQGQGIDLLSNENQRITKKSILDAIYQLKQKIRQDKPNNPLIIVYYMGHGIGAGYGTYYLALGDYDFSEAYDVNPFEFSNLTIHLARHYKEKDILSDDEIALTLYTFKTDEKYANLDKLYSDPELAVSNIFVNKEASGKELKEAFEKYVSNPSKFEAQFDKVGKDIVSKSKKFQNIQEKILAKKNLKLVLDINSISLKQAWLKAVSKAQLLVPDYADNKEKYFMALDEEVLKAAAEVKPEGFEEIDESGSHVPYMVILDSCFDGIKDDDYIMGINNLVKGIYQVINAKNNRFINEDDEIFEVIKKDQEQEFIIKSKLAHAITKGSIFKKYGAFFFAANPGNLSTAYDSPGEPDDSINKDLKPGLLAKRFDIALNTVKKMPGDISLKKFIEIFNAIELDLDIPNENKPFYWFSSDSKAFDGVFLKAP
jgi:hypothetical protein